MVLWRSSRAVASESTAADAAVDVAAALPMSSSSADAYEDNRAPSPEETDSTADEAVDMAALDEAASSLGSASEFCARNGLTDCGPASTSAMAFDDDGGGGHYEYPQQLEGAGGLTSALDSGGYLSDATAAPPLFPSLSTAGGGGSGQPPMSNFPANNSGPSGIWPPSQEKSKKMKRDRSGNATGG
eukprot:CAMPEP_0201934512 /NCGR_PEP_ID=MMETSP0903-20130614/33761_1 /ASSEMBLY_ACC=CAM_ASM_000552 /TAXON_ID=420261 /ORGANISM="Thalassiosira antarctica, Strain CCMP982" /LENGTH=185 /DNA_ID=CAMNT_0048474745 /DNA_START=60 /DNA_END=614 /DNA_ORIENTATION=-